MYFFSLQVFTLTMLNNSIWVKDKLFCVFNHEKPLHSHGIWQMSLSLSLSLSLSFSLSVSLSPHTHTHTRVHAHTHNANWKYSLGGKGLKLPHSSQSITFYCPYIFPYYQLQWRSKYRTPEYRKCLNTGNVCIKYFYCFGIGITLPSKNKN